MSNQTAETGLVNYYKHSLTCFQTFFVSFLFSKNLLFCPGAKDRNQDGYCKKVAKICNLP